MKWMVEIITHSINVKQHKRVLVSKTNVTVLGMLIGLQRLLYYLLHTHARAHSLIYVCWLQPLLNWLGLQCLRVTKTRRHFPIFRGDILWETVSLWAKRNRVCTKCYNQWFLSICLPPTPSPTQQNVFFFVSETNWATNFKNIYMQLAFNSL